MADMNKTEVNKFRVIKKLLSVLMFVATLVFNNRNSYTGIHEDQTGSNLHTYISCLASFFFLFFSIFSSWADATFVIRRLCIGLKRKHEF